MEKMDLSVGEPHPSARVVGITPKQQKISDRRSMTSEERVSRFVVITPDSFEMDKEADDGCPEQVNCGVAAKEREDCCECPLAKGSKEVQNMEIETLSNLSDTDTGKTLEPKPKRISDFFGFRRSSGRYSEENEAFDQSKNIRSPAGDNSGAGAGDGPSTSNLNRGEGHARTETAVNKSKPGSSSFRRRLEVAFARSESADHQSNPWFRLKKAILKKKYNLYNTQKGLEILKLDDGAGDEHHDNGTSSFSGVELDSHKNQQVQIPEPLSEAEPDNRNAILAAQERILSLPYRTHKKQLKKEMQAQIAFCKRQRKMMEQQLKANLRQNEKREKEEIAVKMRQNKAIERSQVKQVKFGSWKKMLALKEHKLGGRCREIMAKYRGDKNCMELQIKSKQQRLERILEEKLIKLEIKKERKQRMLREKMIKEMKAVEDEIKLAKSKLNADDPENDVLDALLIDASSVADEGTSGTQAS